MGTINTTQDMQVGAAAIQAVEILPPETFNQVEQRIARMPALGAWLAAETAKPLTGFQYLRLTVGVVAYLLTEALTAALRDTSALKAEIQACKVVDAQTNALASAMLARTKGAQKTITEAFDPLVAFLREPLDSVYARRKKLLDEWTAAERTIKQQIGKFQEQEQARVMRENAERERRVREEQRAEEARRAKEAEEARLAAQQAEQAKQAQVAAWQDRAQGCLAHGDLLGYAEASNMVAALGAAVPAPQLQPEVAPPVLMAYSTADALPVMERARAAGASTRFHLVARVADIRLLASAIARTADDDTLTRRLLVLDPKAAREWCDTYEKTIRRMLEEKGLIEGEVMPGLVVKDEAIVSGRT